MSKFSLMHFLFCSAIVYGKLFLPNCNNIRDGGAAWFMGGPASQSKSMC